METIIMYQTTNSHYFRTYNSGSGDDKAVIDASVNFTTEGNVTAYGSVSDERLKENIKVIENPIEKIKDLKGVTFTYKKEWRKKYRTYSTRFRKSFTRSSLHFYQL